MSDQLLAGYERLFLNALQYLSAQGLGAYPNDDRVIAHLAEGAAVLGLVQLLDASDREPSAGGTIALTDSESGEQLERELGERVLEGYRRRFRGHQASVAAAASRSRAVLCELSAGDSLEVNCRSRLFGRLLEARP